MATVFWDIKEVLMAIFMQQGTIIMPQGYCETLKMLHRAIQYKWHGMLKNSVELLQDNDCLHTATHT
jgi:hypothetical protein